MKRIVVGGLLGGIVLFIWSSIYWAASGIPIGGMSTFRDEAAVEQALRENVSGPGYYVLPTPDLPPEPGVDAATQANQRMEKIATRFFFAGAVQPGGIGGLGRQLGLSFLGNVVAAAMMTFLLGFVSPASYVRRLQFTVTAALFAAVVCHYPELVWWGYPAGYTALLFLDVLVGWTAAGLVLARVTRDA